MKKPHTQRSSIPSTGLKFGEQAAKNIENARKQVQADTANRKDLTKSVKNLRDAVAASCRESHPEWVTKFATGKMPSDLELSDETIELLIVLEQELRDGKVNPETLDQLDEMLSY
ncbi:hypothetical protein ICA16_22940 [Pseudomonas anatoliensis]|uniref:hypothetical protein n=1 Tax=Pseudomonas anatoliensis TaxID=2710589 RepID=UPI001B3367ED|nr:hypothetical protein [Pseudomonas anatoliensis]MBP5958534.1 hypothetical protein [Pseudomonas anatoliensis]